MKKDILKHQLVPEHVVLNDSEAKRVLKELDVHPEQLPKIKTTDPVVKAIGAKRGDIVKIIRRSATAEEFITYRLVQD
ncbi:DNA-directed RNA polymerase subunit H [Methanothermobacter wolfeii]|uniref:DNA-directed RNA polymerase subunit Rpo5 n=1 Tax=Methanothermobacter wolfeii TaxID=145261 RepID=A0ABU8TTE2_METWO|nr:MULTISPECIES: DNA-directed RNA polymerase subunit H [Methanothermobacter]MDI6702020.1 DNA-directed RNA polymerase subunit H [Methanothermobacter wolfeii]MDI6842520.1 DNA-directed RNA polymerase subunit H [Methanothermobacter wolfeii]NLM02095.1 DNA-directed RNA polymerase subunit H [Methanothermobacter wolfeii]QHN06781.1 DNA-directed RNA polymerase subunit H [Methanothermobacter sp. THM-1]